MAEISEDKRRDYLRDEYLFLQAQYEDYDRRSLTIKSWVTGGATAALAIGFSSTSKYAFFLPVMVAIIAAIVWYLEACWKLFQYSFTARIEKIESYFRGDLKASRQKLQPFQIYKSWFESYRRFRARDLCDCAGQRFVYLPYLPLILLCAISVALLTRHPPPESAPAAKVSENNVRQ